MAEYAVPAGAFTEQAGEDFAFASAVAEFGLILTDSEYRSGAGFAGVSARAGENKGRDIYNLRAEFITPPANSSNSRLYFCRNASLRNLAMHPAFLHFRALPCGKNTAPSFATVHWRSNISLVDRYRNIVD